MEKWNLNWPKRLNGMRESDLRHPVEVAEMLRQAFWQKSDSALEGQNNGRRIRNLSAAVLSEARYQNNTGVSPGRGRRSGRRKITAVAQAAS